MGVTDNKRLHLTDVPVTRLACATRVPCRLRRLPLQVNLHIRLVYQSMKLSSARLTPIRSTSKHEWRILVAGVALFVLGVIGGISRTGYPELSKLVVEAAGVAFVYVAQSEAKVWRRPLTLGHQLTMWWFWPFVVPVFFVATRDRRSTSMTLAVIITFVGVLMLLLGVFVRDIMRFI